jgi:hypothetical protein
MAETGTVNGGSDSMAEATARQTPTSGEVGGMTADDDRSGRGYHLEIFLVSFAALLLEISYTRVVSFKLFYYYTYLVIGLALLGIGAGSVFVTLSGRLRRASTDGILMVGSLVGAASVAVGYLVVARLPIASLAVWDYGTRDSVENLAKLLVLCLALFVSFVPIGVMISTLFSRRTDGIGKLYFADLVGAGLACAVVVFLIASIGPPRTIMLAGTILALVALHVAWSQRARIVGPASATVAAALAVGVVASGVLPDVRHDDDKSPLVDIPISRWSPIFRVDAAEFGDQYVLHHDGMLGSVVKKWDGERASLTQFDFDQDPRSFPFGVLDESPGKVMIIGAAGGHEILASLYFEADQIDAIELNPVTYDLVTDELADENGHLAEQPGVNYRNGDGRSFLARSDDEYDLIWYPAPDSYSAANAATAGAFVLSESYLYTSETIQESLDHLTDDGIVAAQFGEANYTVKPNRTTRYVSTVRDALENEGIDDPGAHVLVSTFGLEGNARLSTVLVKKTPFTREEIENFAGFDTELDSSELQYAPGRAGDNTVSQVMTLPGDELDAFLDDYPYGVDAISDDGPFFWHFARFGDVVRNFGDPIDRFDPEDSIGERVIVLLLAIAAVFAAVFLLLPFVGMRKVWRGLPRKGTSAVYFVALGLGFMFFEITLIQRLILFLGFPTYSLTVTLASLLIFTGVGALSSRRFAGRVDQAIRALVPTVVALALMYLFALPVLTDALLTTPLAVRVVVAFVVLAPLGVCLGMFMPLGLGAVASLTDHSQEYVAWGWAVNGFASVIGSVLTTLIAMMYGFNVVLALAGVVYLVALVALRRLKRPIASGTGGAGDDGETTAAATEPTEPTRPTETVVGVPGDGRDGSDDVAVGAGPPGAGPAQRLP